MKRCGELPRSFSSKKMELKELNVRMIFPPMFQHLFVSYILRVILLVDGWIYNASCIVSLLSLIVSHF